MALKLELESETSLVQSETGDVSVEVASIQPESAPIFVKTKSNERKKDDNIFIAHGYIKMNKICDTLQGELYKASVINKNSNKPQYVAIKKTSKLLFNERIAIRDEITFCVSENILKEAVLLKHLTMITGEISKYIINYVDFFQSDTDYYLVTEYVCSEINLKQFVTKAQKYIHNGTLDYKQYKKVIKYILWQVFVAIQWLHESVHLCHLDLGMENIMLKNAKFIKSKTGISIDPNISIKLTDFGVAEIFDISNDKNNNNPFICSKQGLTLDNECYAAPNVFNMEKFDSRASDNWSLGMILFECMTLGLQLYEPMTMHSKGSGYHALYTNKLKQYIIAQNMSKYFNSATFSLLEGLLNVKEKNRLTGMDILQQKYFKTYYERYGKRINQEFNQQKQKTSEQQIRMKEKKFPFYKCY
eukprot:163691_1